ncbi:MAG: acyl-CoA dehydrogenase family protein, partial [Caulobacterales bacterium]
MLDTSSRSIFLPEHEQFRDQVRRFVAREFTPNLEAFEQAGVTSREFWRKTGEMGFLCPGVPEAYGGLGLDFIFNAVVNEELSYACASDCILLQSDVTLPYILHYGSEEQKSHWLPKMVQGEVITAIAMTEPGAGSDLQGVRTNAVSDG